ncbi:hypothetical protein JAAARDRAFT_32422 [Jaapia argillacea MUCL 33604]|uniref:Pyruvate carboxylase n=1 Tax=Jaapia argillacea MUCL 33604 TaxID=933084 RepID=A0A067PZC5_9AGAM|nr:hypothetical protein JAAARDRAFT_32422 [Jaapia argillacea MUCL 33604]
MSQAVGGVPRVLVANRGEIAIRILRSARELGWDTVAVYTENDTSHTTFADQSVKLESTHHYTDVLTITNVVHKTECTHLHPGYGFLSESPSLPHALSNQIPRITFIGPSIETLTIASDKMRSRELAISQGVPVSPGVNISSPQDVRAFVSHLVSLHGKGGAWPVIIKALDGGGGRGIRIVEKDSDVEEAFKRCLGESPSGKLFVEKALSGPGWKHIEVQVVGDGTGEVKHLWERECSVQRRFQKIVEMAPSTLPQTKTSPLLEASLKMATHLKYKGLGTFEYLVNAYSNEWVFLEINPRVQVEHTVTEEITNVDLVRTQLLLSLPNTSLRSFKFPASPSGYAIQLRLTAEDPSRAFQLSVGSIHPSDISWPAGRGVRTDTWLCTSPSTSHEAGTEWTVGPDFDSLLAKIIVRGNDFEETNQRALRALKELRFEGGVKTNLEVLAGVVGHEDWVGGKVYTTWLERNLSSVLEAGQRIVSRRLGSWPVGAGVMKGAGIVSGSVLLQPGTTFHLELSPQDPSNPSSASPLQKHTMMLSSIAHNTFPDRLSGVVQTTFSPTPHSFSLTQSSSAAVSSSSFELADPGNPSHIASPLTGKVVELHPAFSEDEGGGWVKEGETLVVLSVMKMENVVVAPRSGVLKRRGKGVEVGIVVGEGMLLCVIGRAKSRL